MQYTIHSIKQSIATALESIQDIPDGLKAPAFQTILGQLLQSPISSEERGNAAKRVTPKSAGKEKASTVRRPKGGTSTWLNELADEGFFNSQRTIGDVKIELANRSHHVPTTALTAPLQRMCHARRLRRLKVGPVGKQAWAWSNW